MEVISLALSVLLVSFIYLYLVRRSKSYHDEPPCLPWLPVVGSLPYLTPAKNVHLALTEKAKKLGNVFAFYAGSSYTVVLCGYDAIREALIKNGAEFAGRGDFFVDGRVYTDPGKGIVLRQYGDNQHQTRSTCLTVLKNFGYGSRDVMESKITQEVEQLLNYIRSLKGAPWYPKFTLKKTTLSVIYNLVFDVLLEYEDTTTEYLTSCIKMMADSADAMYNIFPSVALIPHVKKTLDKYREEYIDFMNFIEKKIDETLKNSANENNFVTEYKRIVRPEEFNRRELAVIIRDLITAGTESVSDQLNWALIFLANNLEVQSKLQREIDSVVERGRLPLLDDKPKLPYLEATILEVMRIRTAAPLSVPRCTIAETKLFGYRIPANTQIIPNLWSAHMDEGVWSDPTRFRPERFLDESNTVINRDLMITFSLVHAGKRSCLGEVLARQELFLFLSAMIQQFNVLPPEGEDKVKEEMCCLLTLAPESHLLRLVARD